MGRKKFYGAVGRKENIFSSFMHTCNFLFISNHRIYTLSNRSIKISPTSRCREVESLHEKKRKIDNGEKVVSKNNFRIFLRSLGIDDAKEDFTMILLLFITEHRLLIKGQSLFYSP
jgi:hypothetical protein